MIKIILIVLLGLILQACSTSLPPIPPEARRLPIIIQNYKFKEVINKLSEGSEPYNVWFSPNTLIINKYNQKELKFIHDGVWKNYSLCYSDDNGNSWVFLPHSTNYLGKIFTIVDFELANSSREYRIIRIP